MTDVAMQREEGSKAVVREYVEAFNRGDLQRLKELLADDAEIQGVKAKGTFEKVEPVWRQLIDGYGVQLKIEGLIAEGKTVAVRYLEPELPGTGIFPKLRVNAFRTDLAHTQN
jgi:SnoaL-like domain